MASIGRWCFLRIEQPKAVEVNLHGVDAWMVFLYFFRDTDMQGPESEDAWLPYIEDAHQYLGLNCHTSHLVTIFYNMGEL